MKNNPDLINIGQKLNIPTKSTLSGKTSLPQPQDYGSRNSCKIDWIPDLFLKSASKLPEMTYAHSNQYAVSKQKPSIELFARDVQYTAGMAQHSFSIFTDSRGRQTIITAYPEKNIFIGTNLEVVDAPYIDENKKLFYDDWKKEDSKHLSIYKLELNNDQELNNYLAKARATVKMIEFGNNGGRFDYDICITDKCWGGNSNTVQRAIYDSMGIKLEIPKNLNLLGIDGKFYDGPLDDFWRKYDEALQKQQP